jgi:hypothetical protein
MTCPEKLSNGGVGRFLDSFFRPLVSLIRVFQRFFRVFVRILMDFSNTQNEFLPGCGQL